MNKTNFLLCIFIGFIISSCSNSDDNNDNDIENSLIGVWLRTGTNVSFDERYTFNSNSTGNYSIEEGSFSSSEDFTWSIENYTLTTIDDDDGSIGGFFFNFNSNGQLVIGNDSSYTFDKIE